MGYLVGGVCFFVSILGNIWPALNPWTAVFDAVRFVAGKPGISAKGPLRVYPSSLGVWPSVLLFVVFAWLEIVSSAGEHPGTLACLILAYSVLTLCGMVIFGRDSWLASGEVFHQVFGVLGRFSLFGTRDGIVTLRPFGAGLFTSAPVHPSMMVFIIVLLSTVTFDGFVETPVWAGLLEEISESRFLRPMLIWMQSIGIDLLVTIKTGALLIFPVVFLAIFWAFCAASRAIADGNVSVSQLANTLVLSLVPIAIAYHIAHYLSYLLIAGQLIVPLASDPFGWDLFGTASQAMDVGVINSATVWYVAVVAIILGHVIAVWLAHLTAISLYADKHRALLSQIPMLILMVLYTMTSLWILSQPIVEV